MKKLANIAEWEGTGGGPGSGGALLQTSIHMSVAHVGEHDELLENTVGNFAEDILDLENRLKLKLHKLRENFIEQNNIIDKRSPSPNTP